MSFDGNGNYVRIHNWTQDAANGLNINAGEMDQEDNSIQGAFNLCLTRDGQGKMGADFVPGSPALYNLGTAGSPWLNVAAKSGTIGPPASGVAWTVNSQGINGSCAFNSTVGTPAFNTYTIAGVIKAYNGVAANVGDLVADSGVGDFVVRTNATTIRFTTNNALSSAVDIDTNGNLNVSNGTAAIVGPVYAGIPINSQAGNYSAVLLDANKTIVKTGAGAATITIPANSAVAFPVGTAISVHCSQGTTALSITVTTDSLIWAANGSLTNTRTLAAAGLATLLKINATSWLISGTGLS